MFASLEAVAKSMGVKGNFSKCLQNSKTPPLDGAETSGRGLIISPSPALQGRRGGLWRGCRGAGEAGLKVPWFDGEVNFLFSSLNEPEGGIIV